MTVVYPTMVVAVIDYVLFAEEDFKKGLRKVYVDNLLSISKEGGNLIRSIACDAAANRGHEEGILSMLTSERYKTLYSLFCAVEAFHGWDGIGLTLETFTVTPLSTKVIEREAGGTTSVMAEMVGAEDKNLSRKEGTDAFGGDSVGRAHKYQSNIDANLQRTLTNENQLKTNGE